jgi:hypothetical protein
MMWKICSYVKKQIYKLICTIYRREIINFIQTEILEMPVTSVSFATKLLFLIGILTFNAVKHINNKLLFVYFYTLQKLISHSLKTHTT